MSPGLPEEAGKVAAGVVDSLKSQPISLALIVLNVIFLVIGYLILAKVSDRAAADMLRADELIAKLATQCAQTTSK